MTTCDFSEHFAKADNKAQFKDTKAVCLSSDQGSF